MRRLVWERMTKTELPKNRWVTTTCGDSKCLNPDHLKATEFRRAAWLISRGSLPESRRHIEVTCGNVRCLNPKHLICPTTEERFWSHVDKTEGCWNWTGAFSKTNVARRKHFYGAFCFRENKERVWVMAHRYSYELAYGKIVGHVPGDEGQELCVLHHCDNPKCVRPDHLFLGTDQDNHDDMVRKGRHARGPALAEAMRTAREARTNMVRLCNKVMGVSNE